ncbi:MAG: hypothetical protein AAF800_09120 [Planctomycetota bacterium]
MSKTEPTVGKFTLAEDHGRWSFVSPDGRRMFTIGVNHLGSLEDPGAAERVAAAWNVTTAELWERVTQHLTELGCNTIGYHAPDALRDRLPCFVETDFHDTSHCLPGQRFAYPDVFDPTFQTHVRNKVRETCEKHRHRKNLIGYFWTDTPRWHLDTARGERASDWVTATRRLGPDTPGKRAYVDFLRETYAGDFAALARGYRLDFQSFDDLLAYDFAYQELTWPAVRRDDQAFLARTAEELYRVTAEAFRTCDPGRLLLGERYKSHDHHDGVLRAAARYVDAISIQDGPEIGPLPGPGRHESVFDRGYFDHVHGITGKPILVCDHNISFRTEAHPVTLWHACDTPEQAAELHTAYLCDAAATPYVIGYGRCQYLSVFDPKRGLLKQGLLQEDGRPYPESNHAMSRATTRALALRKQAAEPLSSA